MQLHEQLASLNSQLLQEASKAKQAEEKARNIEAKYSRELNLHQVCSDGSLFVALWLNVIRLMYNNRNCS